MPACAQEVSGRAVWRSIQPAAVPLFFSAMARLGHAKRRSLLLASVLVVAHHLHAARAETRRLSSMAVPVDLLSQILR